MRLSRRVLAPFVGLVLALSLAISPVSAAPAQQQFGGFSFCRILNSFGSQLPDIPGVHQAWLQVLASLGCSIQNGNGPA